MLQGFRVELEGLEFWVFSGGFHRAFVTRAPAAFRKL